MLRLAIGLVTAIACRAPDPPPSPEPDEDASAIDVGTPALDAALDAAPDAAEPLDADLASDAEAIDQGTTPEDANGSPDAAVQVSALALGRDRVLALYAIKRGGVSLCLLWSSMNDSERGVFLTTTDLLGKRSWMMPNGDLALDHVVDVHAVIGAQQTGCVRCCGNRAYNRIYFSADDDLIDALRNDSALPLWGPSNDPRGSHAPFNQSSETSVGLPTGQAQFFAADSDAVPLERDGVETVLDPHAIELDIDYNFIHDSNPECDYGQETGRERYEAVWMGEGVGGSAEFDYSPTGCP